MLITTLTVDADQPTADALERLAGLPDEALVVVRRRVDLLLAWFTYRAGLLRDLGAGREHETVAEVLNLAQASASLTVQLGDTSYADSGVLLDGDEALGILLGDRGSGGRGQGGRDLPDLSYLQTQDPYHHARPDEPFGAYPQLECPIQVPVGTTFELLVSLTTHESEGTSGGLVTVATDLQEFDLVVTLVAMGFTATRVRDVLRVDRSDLSANEVRFSLTAEPIDGTLFPATLQVDFSFGGELCGRAWRTLVVTSADSAAAPIAKLGGLGQQLASTPVLVTSSERPPDLVVTISENDDGTQLEWHCTTPHAGIELPAAPVRTRFRSLNAKAFAMEQIRVIDQSRGIGAAASRMMGTARTIADEVPPEIWRVLSAVWGVAKSERRVPTLLLVSTDAFIPWELASTEPDYLDRALVDSGSPPLLGAQVCVSRWNAPKPRGVHGVLVPQLPPPVSVRVDGLAVVVGDYLAQNGIRPLPKATDEGNELAARYRAVRFAATLGEISPLFRGTVVREGQPFDPDVVHFACHGQVDPNPGFNGIVLNEVNQRLDALYVAGSRMKRPFVFLNACQVGQNTQLLDDAGGLATSFLKTGASGFVAPLWNVDDQLAHDTALEFYRAAFTDRITVAEVLRRRRALFDPDAAQAELTHLAYIYFGHPNLELVRAG